MPLFPMFLRLERRECLVVGAGAVAEEKICGLLEAGAIVRLIAPSATEGISLLARERKLMWLRRTFRVSDVSRKFLIVAATSSPDVHETIWRAACRANVLCNVVDDPRRCEFFYGAVVRRGALQIAVSTGGRSPALAQQIRKRLEKQFGVGYVERVERLGRARTRLLISEPNAAWRKKTAHRMARGISLPGSGRLKVGIRS
jgi:precorrin-2 dehydrogenase/sirohydrochlorin ferrochelatase